MRGIHGNLSFHGRLVLTNFITSRRLSAENPGFPLNRMENSEPERNDSQSGKSVLADSSS